MFKKKRAVSHGTGLQVVVTLVSGANLPAKDTNGLSDPYCIFSVSGSRKKTKSTVKKNTINPHWNETFTLGVPSAVASVLKILVYDYDLLSRDDKIGYVSLPLANLVQNVDTSFTLGLQGKQSWSFKGVRGTITFKVRPVGFGQRQAAPAMMQQPRQPVQVGGYGMQMQHQPMMGMQQPMMMQQPTMQMQQPTMQMQPQMNRFMQYAQPQMGMQPQMQMQQPTMQMQPQMGTNRFMQYAQPQPQMQMQMQQPQMQVPVHQQMMMRRFYQQ